MGSRWRSFGVGYTFVSVFFFSSRRRHTRCSRDWSSDVCLPISDARPRAADPRRAVLGARPGEHRGRPRPHPRHEARGKDRDLLDPRDGARRGDLRSRGADQQGTRADRRADYAGALVGREHDPARLRRGRCRAQDAHRRHASQRRREARGVRAGAQRGARRPPQADRRQGEGTAVRHARGLAARDLRARGRQRHNGPWRIIMRKSLLVAQREIIEQVKTKGVWIGILLFPIIIVGAIGLPIYIERAKSVRTFAVRDSSAWLADAVAQEARASDTRRLLLEAQRRQIQNKDVEALPPVLRAVAPVVAKLPPSQLDSASRALAFGDSAPVAGVSEPNRTTILAALQEYRVWFDSASAPTIRSISSGPAKAKYEQVPATGDLDQRVADGELFAYLSIGRDP